MNQHDALLAHIPADLHTRDVVGVLSGMDADCSTMPILLDAIRDAGGTEDHVLAMVRALIYGVKGADAPRLWYADWLEEAGEVERAAFSRQPSLHCHGDSSVGQACGYHRKEDGQLILCDVCEQLHKLGVDARLLGESINGDYDKYEVRYGFLRSVTLDWSSWLRHHAGLFWSSRQTVVCPKSSGSCVGGKVRLIDAEKDHGVIDCRSCSGAGRIPRTFVASAQPLETVRISAWPEGCLAFLANMRFNLSGYRFDRVKCDVCGGSGWEAPVRRYVYGEESSSQSRCQSCHGEPLNLWECEVWPGLVFSMPR